MKETLHQYLRDARACLLWKLEGLGEHDVRRPLTPTGTNLLGLVKHVSVVEAGYLGVVFARPFPEPLPWGDDAEPDADLWVREDESREDVLGLHARATAHADATVAALPLGARGRVPWWPAGRDEVTLHHVLVHLVAEAQRHAGHADVLRESLDGAAGLLEGRTNLPDLGPGGWTAHRDRVQQAADAFR